MKKPEILYQTQWFLLVTYGDFDIRQCPYHIPLPFHNFHTNRFDAQAEPEKLYEVIEELFADWAVEDHDDEESYVSWVKSKKWTIYWVELPSEIIFHNLNDLIDRLVAGWDTTTLTVSEYNFLITWLPEFKEYEIRYPKDVQ